MINFDVGTQKGYAGYPKAEEGPTTEYKSAPTSNPVLRGLPLAIAGSAIGSIGALSGFLWSNAGFRTLRDLDLSGYEPRYDPTVIPLAGDSDHAGSATKVTYRPSVKVSKRQYNIADYNAAFETGKLTPTAVAEALLELSKSTEHKAAFLDIKKDKVLAAAAAATKRFQDGQALGMLDGVPIGIKDEVDLQGHTMTLGSVRDFTDPRDITSWCIQKWQEAGCVIIGKLNMHELGLDTTGNNPTTGTPLNPHNPHYYPGGSSSGSAYAVAAGLLPIALGVDGGGSIRIPSAFCGIYGLKPSHNRVSRSPSVNTAASCSTVGPMASNMADLEYAYRIMATPNPSDPASALFPSPFTPTPTQPTNKTIGIYKPYFDTASSYVLKICKEALSQLQSAGYQIIDIHLPHLPSGQLAHAMTILSEISCTTTSLTGLSPANKILLAVGGHTPATDFLLAQKLRTMLMQHLAYLFQKHPGLLIVTPTTPLAGWHISGGAADLKRGVSDANISLNNMTYVWMANFLGCPSLSVPVGRVAPMQGEGRVPVGLMAMGEWGDEDGLIEWGRCAEGFAWGEGEEKMARPGKWVDLLGVGKQ